jgi:hypothetical protein
MLTSREKRVTTENTGAKMADLEKTEAEREEAGAEAAVPDTETKTMSTGNEKETIENMCRKEGRWKAKLKQGDRGSGRELGAERVQVLKAMWEEMTCTTNILQREMNLLQPKGWMKRQI